MLFQFLSYFKHFGIFFQSFRLQFCVPSSGKWTINTDRKRCSKYLTFTDDFDGDIRQGNGGYVGTGTAPDIGADEFVGQPI
jgi:hypothetical protein